MLERMLNKKILKNLYICIYQKKIINMLLIKGFRISGSFLASSALLCILVALYRRNKREINRK